MIGVYLCFFSFFMPFSNISLCDCLLELLIAKVDNGLTLLVLIIVIFNLLLCLFLMLSKGEKHVEAKNR